MNYPKVSICIPTYNQPDYLKVVLDSITIQDFKDYEVIISDDSTNSESTELVEKYKTKIPNLLYERNIPSKKSPKSWNEAIKHAKGDYIKVLHSDDWFPDSSSLYKFVKMLDSNPQSDFAFSAAYVCGPEKKVKSVYAASPSKLKKLKRSATYLFGRNIIGAPSATIYRASVTHKYYEEKMKWVVDVDQYISLLGDNDNIQYSAEPLICITSGSPHQSIHESVGLAKIELFEWLYLYTKIRKRNKRIKYRFFIWLYIMFVLKRCHISSLSQIEDLEIEPEEQKLVGNLLKFKFMFFIFKIRSNLLLFTNRISKKI